MLDRCVLALCLVACGTTGDHDVTLRIHGAGSIAGSVHSDPDGLDCVLVANGGGSNEIECIAALDAGPVALTFEPSGAAATARFDVDGELCEGRAASGTCTFELRAATLVDVFPISVPPP